MSTEVAPAIIDSAYVRAFAELGSNVRFTGKQHIYVDGVLAGPAAKIAVAFNESSDYLILLCDSGWSSYACGAGAILEEAISLAELWYDGLAGSWTYTHYTVEEDKKNIEEFFSGHDCSFCGKYPHEVQESFYAEKAVICSDCILNIHAYLIRTSDEL